MIATKILVLQRKKNKKIFSGNDQESPQGVPSTVEKLAIRISKTYSSLSFIPLDEDDEKFDEHEEILIAPLEDISPLMSTEKVNNNYS